MELALEAAEAPEVILALDLLVLAITVEVRPKTVTEESKALLNCMVD